MVKFLDVTYSTLTWNGMQSSMTNLFSNGTWVSSWDRKGFTPPFSTPCIFEHPAVLKYIDAECLLSNENIGNYYSWKPARGDLIPWDPAGMCGVANGRTIMFLGDSMQLEFYFSFVSAVMDRTSSVLNNKTLNSSILEEKRKSNSERCEKLCEWNTDCTKPFKVDCGDSPAYSVMFARTFHLDGFHHNPIGAEARGLSNTIKTHNVSLIFMNIGAHYQPDDVLLRNVNATLTYLYAQYPSISIIFRNTAHGHDHCEVYMRSPPVETEYAKHFFLEVPPLFPIHNWHSFNAQNTLVQALIAAYFPQVFFIDIATSTNRRADSHVSKDDCLHYCLPGPLSEWVTFHYNALIIISGISDIPPLTPSSSTTSTTSSTSATSVATAVDRSSYPPLRDGDIFKSPHHPAHYLYTNGSKLYLSPSNLAMVLSVLNCTVRDVRVTGLSTLIVTPTRTW